MGESLKLNNIDFAKVGNSFAQARRAAGKLISEHKPEFLIGALSLVAVDNIRVRMGRNKDQKSFEVNAVAQQEIIRKHEAEINVLKERTEQAKDAKERVDLLEKIVKNITGGDVTE